MLISMINKVSVFVCAPFAFMDRVYFSGTYNPGSRPHSLDPVPMSTCTRCKHRRGALVCVCCTNTYCSQRCLAIDTRHGPHRHGPTALRAALPLNQGHDQKDTDLDPVLAAFLYAPRTVPRYAQGCGNYEAFGVEAHANLSALHLDHAPQPEHLALHDRICKATHMVHPITHASPRHPLVLVPHLPRSKYLHLGEDTYASDHVMSVQGLRRGFPDTTMNCSYCVGLVLGQLHYVHGVDAYNFAVTLSSSSTLRVHLDPLYTNVVNPQAPEVVETFGAILGMSPYVPRADQGPAFDAFCSGYAKEAKENMPAVIEHMRFYLS